MSIFDLGVFFFIVLAIVMYVGISRNYEEVKQEKSKANVRLLAKMFTRRLFNLYLMDFSYSRYESWKPLYDWLGIDPNQSLSPSRKKIERGILAYLSRGISPITSLNFVFKVAKDILNHKAYTEALPPIEVINLFDNFFSKNTDVILTKGKEKLKEKNSELHIESKQEVKVIEKDLDTQKNIEYVGNSFKVKMKKFISFYKFEIFVSSVWFIFFGLILYIFDPLDINYYNWEVVDYLKNIFILTLPIQFFLIRSIYLKFIKP